MKRTIKIHVAGQQYILRSDADEGYVQSLAEFVNARVNALKGSRQVATQSDVVLAALKLADELEQERKSHQRLRTQARQQVLGMLDRLNVYVDKAERAEPTESGAKTKKAAAKPATEKGAGEKKPRGTPR